MIDNKILRSMFQKILRIRLIEEKIVELYSEQEIRCPVHLSIGQEGVAVGICECLDKNDIVMSNHRSHGHYLANGGDLKKFFAEIYGKATGCSLGRGGSMHLIDLSVNFWGSTPIVAGSIPVATGIAFAEKLRHQPTAIVSFFGDAAIEEGVFHESLNFAVLKKLPILYVCENNFYAVNTPLSERQPDRKISDFIKGYHLPSWQEDGNDVLKVYEAGNKALKTIRAGEGPVFLELMTYRYREHCGPNFDDRLGYRTKKEVDEWQKKCPVERLKSHLLDKRIITQVELDQWTAQFNSEINAAVEFAKTSPFPSEESMAKDVYAR